MDTRFMRKETQRKRNKDGTERVYETWVERKSVPVEPLLPYIESAIRMGTSCRKLEERCQVYDTQIYRWLTGATKRSNIDTIDKVCIELGYSLSAIYGDTDELT